MTDTKYCNGPDCRRHRPVSTFQKRRSTGDGLDHFCRYCRSIERQKHRAARTAKEREARQAQRSAKPESAINRVRRLLDDHASNDLRSDHQRHPTA